MESRHKRPRFSRGYLPFTDYTEDLRELVGRGWVEPAAESGTYRLTAQGIQTRQATEDDTDAYFYEVWASLTSAELAKLQALVTSLLTQLPGQSAIGLEPLTCVPPTRSPVTRVRFRPSLL
ncbi:MAG TPA: hypothetical protein VGP82_07015 [Ktedonobacterales bacterium]|nr:hypothetical protein [Ktedonobacterales bacterium]